MVQHKKCSPEGPGQTRLVSPGEPHEHHLCTQEQVQSVTFGLEQSQVCVQTGKRTH